VRNLAQRSATAAKEIKSLIKNSVERVDEGTKLVNQSGATLEEIVVAVKKVNDIISEIAAASQEQYAGITQINKAVSKMDEMTQQNATLVEEATQNSDNMKTQAEALREQLVEFKSTTASPEITTEKPEPKPEEPHPEKKLVSAFDDGDDSDWDEF
jgi:methyl-accepting chemotaxis protein